MNGILSLEGREVQGFPEEGGALPAPLSHEGRLTHLTLADNKYT